APPTSTSPSPDASWTGLKPAGTRCGGGGAGSGAWPSIRRLRSHWRWRRKPVRGRLVRLTQVRLALVVRAGEGLTSQCRTKEATSGRPNPAGTTTVQKHVGERRAGRPMGGSGSARAHAAIELDGGRREGDESRRWVPGGDQHRHPGPGQRDDRGVRGLRREGGEPESRSQRRRRAPNGLGSRPLARRSPGSGTPGETRPPAPLDEGGGRAARHPRRPQATVGSANCQGPGAGRPPVAIDPTLKAPK